MALNTVLVYSQLNQQYVQIGPIYDAESPSTMSTDATITATLYANRIPPSVPGTPVTGATGLTFSYQGGGIYTALIDYDPFEPSAGTNYVTAIDLTTPEGAQAHWEVPSVVTVRNS